MIEYSCDTKKATQVYKYDIIYTSMHKAIQKDTNSFQFDKEECLKNATKKVDF